MSDDRLRPLRTPWVLSGESDCMMRWRKALSLAPGLSGGPRTPPSGFVAWKGKERRFFPASLEGDLPPPGSFGARYQGAVLRSGCRRPQCGAQACAVLAPPAPHPSAFLMHCKVAPRALRTPTGPSPPKLTKGGPLHTLRACAEISAGVLTVFDG